MSQHPTTLCLHRLVSSSVHDTVDRSLDVEVQSARPTVDYYPLNLELDCVHWVDDEETLNKCQEHITMVTEAAFETATSSNLTLF